MSSPAVSPPDVGVVVVAAGVGERAGRGEPKQFRPILGVPMLLRALRPFIAHPDVTRVVVALPPASAGRPPDWLAPLLGERLVGVPGGATRAASVRAGLEALVPTPPVVLVHDAARPFVSRTTIDAVIARARTGVGAAAAVPMGDTVKEVQAAGRVARTVARERLWRTQTPQGFPGAMLVAAYARWSPEQPAPADDAEVAERAGFPVDVVAGSPHNLKVTTEDDWRLAEALARELP
ncbi:MAG: 2-C-methyl-D-erythritol 4-phosphate cytidylyltransferase [Gemmatimonadales bacterium]